MSVALLVCACAPSASAQVVSETHVVYCVNAEQGPSFAMGVGIDGMPSVVPLTSDDQGVSVSVDDGQGNSAKLDCALGCTQTQGKGYCVPIALDMPLAAIGVRCPKGPYAGQVWAASIGADTQSGNMACITNTVGNEAVGWSCTVRDGGPQTSLWFDCTKGCSGDTGCVCIGETCTEGARAQPAAAPRRP